MHLQVLTVHSHCTTEAPEEAYDPRSLFERLQEQKDKKQEEYEEQFKFSKRSYCFPPIYISPLFLSKTDLSDDSGGLPLPSIFDLILGFIHHRLCKNMRWCVFEHVSGCLWVWTDGSDGDQEQVCSCGCWWETGMILASRLHLRIPGDKPTLGLPSDHCCSYCRWFQGCSWSSSTVVIFTDNRTVHDWEKISFSWCSIPQKEPFMESF